MYGGKPELGDRRGLEGTTNRRSVPYAVRRLEPHIEIRRNNDLEGPDFGQEEFRNIDAEIDIRRIAG